MNPKAMIVAWTLWASHACRHGARNDLHYVIYYHTILYYTHTGLSMIGSPDYNTEMRFLLCNGGGEEYVWNSGKSLGYL